MFLILYLKRCYILQIPNNELESICKLPSLLLRLSKLSPLLQSSRKGKVFINWLIYTFFYNFAYLRIVVCFHPLICNSTQEYDTRFRKLFNCFLFRVPMYPGHNNYWAQEPSSGFPSSNSWPECRSSYFFE